MGTIYPVTSLQLTAIHINHPDGSGWVARHEAVDRDLFLRLMPPG